MPGTPGVTHVKDRRQDAASRPTGALFSPNTVNTRKQPLLPVVLLYATGILVASLLSLPLPLVLGETLALSLAALFRARARPWLLYLLAFAIGWANYARQTTLLSPHDLRLLLGTEPQLVTLQGTLIETPWQRVYQQEPEPSWRTVARVEVTALCLDKQTWQPATGRVAVSTPGSLTNFFADQTVELSGVAARPRVALTAGTFDYRRFLEEQGIYYQLQAGEAQDWKLLDAAEGAPLADRFRNWARQALARGLPAEDEALRLEWALTLGWKTALTEEVCEPFVQAATYHIFAVDGLRMAIVFGIFFGVLQALAVPRALCGVVLLPVIWFYVALTGWPASAIRASVMLSVIICGWVLKRPSNPLNSLLAAALIILLWEPRQLFQAGFQLSFVVVLCMILMLPPLFNLVQWLTAPDPLLPESLDRRFPAWVRGPGGYLADLSLTSLAAWIGSLPLAAYYFNIITPVSTPANVLAVPLCALVLISNLASLLFTPWLPSAGVLLNHAGWFLMEVIRISSHWFAHWPAAYWYVPAPSLWTSLLYYAVLLAILTGWLSAPARRLWKIGALALLVLSWALAQWQTRPLYRLTVLPVSGGTALYYDGPGRRADLLVDAGTTNAVQFALKPFLRAQGVNQLPALLLTHGDLRHVGGAEPLVELFSVPRVCTSAVRFRSPTYRRALQHFGAVSNLVQTIRRGDRLGPWNVLHPDTGDRFAQADDNAVVLSARLGNCRVLLLSDLGRAGQNALLERGGDLRADIVISGLPSASEPLSDALLEAVQPRLIIITDSEFPAQERASPKLKARLAQRGIPLIYTRSTGALTFEFYPRSWQAHAMNGLQFNQRFNASEAKSPSAPPLQTVPTGPTPH